MFSDAHKRYCVFDQGPGEFANVFLILFQLWRTNSGFSGPVAYIQVEAKTVLTCSIASRMLFPISSKSFDIDKASAMIVLHWGSR